MSMKGTSPLKTLAFLFFVSLVLSATKEEWKKRSIYQLLTDRFARSDGSTDACPNLGSLHLIKEIIVEEDTKESSIILIIFKEWVSMLSGSHRLSIIEMESIMVMRQEIFIN